MPQQVACASIADLVSALELRQSWGVFEKMEPEKILEYSERFLKKYRDVLVEMGFRVDSDDFYMATLILAVYDFALFGTK